MFCLLYPFFFKKFLLIFFEYQTNSFFLAIQKSILPWASILIQIKSILTLLTIFQQERLDMKSNLRLIIIIIKAASCHIQSAEATKLNIEQSKRQSVTLKTSLVIARLNILVL